MSLSPERTTVLIVGAGPTGLATAISLVHQGFRDILIVEECSSKSPASRAMTIHAATLEALDSVGCAEPLIQLGNKGPGLQLADRSNPLLSIDFACLAPYTRFPFVLLLSQSTTEKYLEAHLNEMGISVLKPERATGFKSNDDGTLDVLFESGRVITAEYVIGADGARSSIRQAAGVGFADPDGMPIDESLGQIIFADVIFSSEHPALPKDIARATASDGKFFLTIELPKSGWPDPESKLPTYRIGFNIPSSSGTPPSSPSTSYLQQHLNERGPTQLSSDASINPNPIHISKTIWSTRFRTHAAIADRFLVHVGPIQRKGIILLVGDAAHIHSPAGGLGMNLGIRDAISLGTTLATHIKLSTNENSKILDDYVSTRRDRALTTIRLTKRFMYVAGVLGSTRLFDFNYWIFRLVANIPITRRRIAWNLSGLGNR